MRRGLLETGLGAIGEPAAMCGSQFGVGAPPLCRIIGSADHCCRHLPGLGIAFDSRALACIRDAGYIPIACVLRLEGARTLPGLSSPGGRALLDSRPAGRTKPARCGRDRGRRSGIPRGTVQICRSPSFALRARMCVDGCPGFENPGNARAPSGRGSHAPGFRWATNGVSAEKKAVCIAVVCRARCAGRSSSGSTCPPRRSCSGIARMRVPHP